MTLLTPLKKFLTLPKCLGIVVVLSFAPSINAAWFESSGQAAILDGNIELARQKATQEAIRQALLFAGASVSSVQKMANGVLHNDDLTIRATGEVERIELIDEIRSDGIITVSIRADIFSQQSSCKASNYTKTIATTWVPLVNRMQASTGNLYDFGSRLPVQLQQQFERFSQHTNLVQILPFYHDITLHQQRVQEVTLIARKANAQYVLLAEVQDLSVSRDEPSAWGFWQQPTASRQFGYHVSLYDGQTGAVIWQKQYQVSAPWEFDLHSSVDINSNELWQSAYGQAVDSVMQDAAQHIDETLACFPAYGRVLQVENENLTIDLGEQHGLQVGDEMTLFQLRQFYDQQGQMFSQYRLHPTTVTITAVSPYTSVATSSDGTYLANIQANDFVSRR